MHPSQHDTSPGLPTILRTNLLSGSWPFLSSSLFALIFSSQLFLPTSPPTFQPFCLLRVLQYTEVDTSETAHLLWNGLPTFMQRTPIHSSKSYSSVTSPQKPSRTSWSVCRGDADGLGISVWSTSALAFKVVTLPIAMTRGKCRAPTGDHSVHMKGESSSHITLWPVAYTRQGVSLGTSEGYSWYSLPCEHSPGVTGENLVRRLLK